MTPVRLEPAALPSRVKHTTTEPLRSRSGVRSAMLEGDDASAPARKSMVKHFMPDLGPNCLYRLSADDKSGHLH